MKNSYFLFPLLLYVWACKPTPRPLNYHRDECVSCKMNVTDPRVSGQLVTHKGKVYAFDAIECMVEYYIQEGGDSIFYGAFINTHDYPEALKDATQATFLHTPALPTPMAININGFWSKEVSLQYRETYGGQLYSWEALLENFSAIKAHARREAQ